MSEQKRNKIVAAVTVNVILLIVILASVVIYQIVQISIINRRKYEIEQEIKYYEQLIQQGGDNLEYWQSYQYLINKALEYGYVYKPSIKPNEN